MDLSQIGRLAAECGFDIAGVAPAEAVPEWGFYREWVRRGMAGEMSYLTDRRGALREDPRSLLDSARSVISVGKLYRGSEPAAPCSNPERGWMSRYAWGDDYHSVMRTGLEALAARLRQLHGPFEYRVAVDTAPLLERALARRAGVGWIGKNTCLINQQMGSFLFLGELLVSLDLEPGIPPPDRCGTCTRCIDACPTEAIVPANAPGGPAWALDSRLCISYFTIELRGAIPEELRAGAGNHVFGCDICQDVCPWNRRAPAHRDSRFAPREFAPPLAELAALDEDAFRTRFRNSPVLRAKHRGLLRNVAVAMGNSGRPEFREPLTRLAASGDAVVAEHARWALQELERKEHTIVSRDR